MWLFFISLCLFHSSLSHFLTFSSSLWLFVTFYSQVCVFFTLVSQFLFLVFTSPQHFYTSLLLFVISFYKFVTFFIIFLLVFTSLWFFFHYFVFFSHSAKLCLEDILRRSLQNAIMSSGQPHMFLYEMWRDASLAGRPWDILMTSI